jgi:hypothetical protein
MNFHLSVNFRFPFVLGVHFLFFDPSISEPSFFVSLNIVGTFVVEFVVRKWEGHV